MATVYPQITCFGQAAPEGVLRVDPPPTYSRDGRHGRLDGVGNAAGGRALIAPAGGAHLIALGAGAGRVWGRAGMPGESCSAGMTVGGEGDVVEHLYLKIGW
jgi:hypothetical protein